MTYKQEYMRTVHQPIKQAKRRIATNTQPQKSRHMRFNEKATIEGFSVQRKIKPIHLTYFNYINTCKYFH